MKKTLGIGWNKKKAILVIAVIFLLGVIIWWANIVPKLNQRYQEYKVLSGIEKLKQSYREDTLGGTTPEETLKMFLVAFKSGDLNLASKYFIPEKQAEYLVKMQNWVRIGRKEYILNLLSQAKWSGQSGIAQDQMDVWNKDNELEMSVFFFQNENSKKWKLKSI